MWFTTKDFLARPKFAQGFSILPKFPASDFFGLYIQVIHFAGNH